MNDFLEYARPAPLKREPVRLSGLLDSCLELLAPVIREKAVRISLSYPPNEANVSADAGQLRQVFLDLCPRRGPGSGERLLRRSVEQNGRRTLVRIRDNRRGVETQEREAHLRAFLYYQAGRDGLRLPMLQRIVLEHGGQLTLDSAPGTDAQPGRSIIEDIGYLSLTMTRASRASWPCCWRCRP